MRRLGNLSRALGLNEIKELKSQSLVEQLTKQLEKERERYRVLSERLHEKESSSLSSKSPRLRRFARKEKHTADKSKASESGEPTGMTVILEKEDTNEAKELEEEIHTEVTPIQPEPLPFPPAEKTSWFGYLRAWIVSHFYRILEDFTDTTLDDDDSGDDDPEGDPLTVRKSWFSVPHVAKKQEHDEGDMGVSDKFQLVLHVARKVQNQLGHMANCLEKIKNLFMWQQVEVTGHLYFMLSVGFISSCIFPAHQLFTVFGFYVGVKLFIIDYIFFRFPRVQQKHDTTARLWKALPTDAQLERRHNRAELDKLVVNQSSIISTSLSSENQNFCELFNLPPSETPIPAWHGGRRCTLINKDKSLTAAFKNGRLYLTNSFLCFERSKSATPKNLVLALKNISKVEKAKPYPWIPGGGMAIEVTMISPEKVNLLII
ncbi:GRAM domain-containing protein 4 [Trichonephila clavipes]|nr:GRAM domain-containing protein 4 [Trichonephila clavipes]